MKTVFYAVEEEKWKELLSFEIHNGIFSAVESRDIVDFTKVEEYILPGFIDAHIHILEDPYKTVSCEDIPNETFDVLWKRAIKNLNDALTVGVTTVKDLGGRFFASVDVKDKIDNSNLNLPNFHTTGCYFSRIGGHGANRGAILIGNISEFNNHLQFLKNRKIEFVKILNDKKVFSDEELKFIIDLAHDFGMLVSVHAFNYETALSAVNAGTDILEHVCDLPEELLDIIENKGVIVVPTYVSAFDSCCNSCEGLGEDISEDLLKEWYVSECKVIPKLFDRNIKVALGSDSGFLGTPCGSIIREIQLLHKHFNINIEKIMKSAYIVTPLTIKRGNQVGLIKKGYSADFICYKENPLHDLKQLEMPNKVFLRGKETEISRIKYRLLSKEDAAQVIKHLYNPFFDCGNINDSWSIEEIEAWLSNRNDICVGAFIEKKLIGFCLTHFHTAVHKVHMENIFVIDKYRKQGVAHNLFYLIKKHYSQKEDKKIRFIGLVDVNNDKALEFLANEEMTIGNKMIWVQLNIEKM